jgi:LytR cell envelope-related transcriptional attenuator
VSVALFAVALSDTVVRVGAYGGLASVVGLGVLSLLYFAQAREVKRLREWAGRAPERAAELEQRVQADAQRRVVAQPLSPATTAAQKAEAARTAAAAALYAQVPPPPPPPPPLVGPPGQLARPALPGAVPAAPAASASAAVTTPASESGTTAGSTTSAPGLPAATAAAATSAARQTGVASPAPLPQENGTSGQETRESAAARPDPPAPLSGSALFADEDDDGGMSTGRIVAIVVGAVAAVLATVVVMVVLTSGDTPARKPNDFGSVSQAGSATPGSSSADGSPASSGVDRRETRVAVLNGTTQTGLARAVADKIEQAKFTIAGTENNADQAVPTTTVSYRAGNERAAQIVAQVIGIDSASVQAVDANTSAAADADVIVIVGADKIG